MLIVDDNRTNRRILHDVVAHWGMRPVLAEQGLEAIALLQQAAAGGQGEQQPLWQRLETVAAIALRMQDALPSDLPAQAVCTASATCRSTRWTHCVGARRRCSKPRTPPTTGSG